MNVEHDVKIPDLLHLYPRVFGDERGYFFESYHVEKYQSVLPFPFVQDNVSFSKKGVLRGLHFQWPNPQGKLVYVLKGRVLDVAVDIRQGSATFGQSSSVVLDGEKTNQYFVPRGFAHGFVVLSDEALFAYKCDALYDPKSEKSLLWSDPDLGIDWQPGEYGNSPVVNQKDQEGRLLKDFSEDELPKVGL